MPIECIVDNLQWGAEETYIEWVSAQSNPDIFHASQTVTLEVRQTFLEDKKEFYIRQPVYKPLVINKSLWSHKFNTIKKEKTANFRQVDIKRRKFSKESGAYVLKASREQLSRFGSIKQYGETELIKLIKKQKERAPSWRKEIGKFKSKIEIPDLNGYTPLMIAIQKGEYVAFQILLKQVTNIHIHAKSYCGFTALHLACEAMHKFAISMITDLLRAGANLDDISYTKRETDNSLVLGRTPAMNFHDNYPPGTIREIKIKCIMESLGPLGSDRRAEIESALLGDPVTRVLDNTSLQTPQFPLSLQESNNNNDAPDPAFDLSVKALLKRQLLKKRKHADQSPGQDQPRNTVARNNNSPQWVFFSTLSHDKDSEHQSNEGSIPVVKI